MKAWWVIGRFEDHVAALPIGFRTKAEAKSVLDKIRSHLHSELKYSVEEFDERDVPGIPGGGARTTLL
jgi:hypothetical protein